MTNPSFSRQDAAPYEVAPEPSLVGYPPPVPATRAPDAPPSPWQAGWAAPAALLAPPRPGPMPDGPREYQQMLRGPRYRWWRPLLTLGLALAIGLPLMLLAFVPVILAGLLTGVTGNPALWALQESLKVNDMGPAGFLYTNLSLIVLIPTAGWSIWIVHRIRPRYLASVRGRIRWRWLLRCVAVVVPVWAIYLGLSALLSPERSARPAHWALLLAMVLVLTPLQAAGEEYLFRGWIMQNVGAWFGNPIVGLVAGIAVSATVFSLAHGSPNIWVLGSLAALAVSSGLAAWRTGGLEAGIAIHAVNNIGVFFTVILLGGWQHAFVGAGTTSTPLVFAIDAGVQAVALALVLWQARRAGIDRFYRPTPSERTSESALAWAPPG